MKPSATPDLSPSQKSVSLFGWLLLGFLSFIWGGSFYFIEVVVEVLPPLYLVFYRVGFAAVTLWIVCLVYRIPIPIKNTAFWQTCLIMGILNNAIPFYLLSFGQSQISGSLAAILNATTPFFALIFGHLFTDDDRIHLGKLLGIITAFMGVILMLLPAGNALDFSRIEGMIACLGASFAYGMAAIWGRRFAKQGIKPIMAATGQLTASTFVLTLGIIIFSDGLLSLIPTLLDMTLNPLFSLLTLAVFCTAMAYLIYFKLLSLVGATNTTLVTMLVPLSAMALGAIFLNESLTLNEWLGLGLIMFGLIIVDGRLTRRILR